MSASLSGRRKTVALTRFMLAIFFLWLLADEWFSMIVSHVSTELEVDLKQAKLRTRPETTEFGLGRMHEAAAASDDHSQVQLSLSTIVTQLQLSLTRAIVEPKPTGTREHERNHNGWVSQGARLRAFPEAQAHRPSE